MSRSHEDEKEIAPGVTARFPLAGRPLYRQRLERLIDNDLVVADITIADVQRFRREQWEAEAYLEAERQRVTLEERRERQALGRGRRRSDLARRYLTPAAGRLL
jgi:hypothetical protein